MFFKKIQYKVQKLLKFIPRLFYGVEVNLGYWLFLLICFVSIVLLSINIFRIIRKGYQRYEIIQSEKSRLEELISKNIQLQEDLKYYSSNEFVDIKAREELNLAFPNQKLVYIEKEEQIEIFGKTEQESKMVPSWRLWYDLIF